MNNTLAKKYAQELDNFDHSMVRYEKDYDLMLREVIDGLDKRQKELPCKYFYDEKGSQLFDQICQLDEYYPTRTELSIMQDNIEQISDVLGDDVMLIEYGSGSSEKIKIILDNIKGIKAYLPVDISMEHLVRSSAQIAAQYKDLEVIPVFADYNRSFIIPMPGNPIKTKIVYFPGSTIGNFHPSEAEIFLNRIKRVVNKHGGLLIGVDLKKDKTILQQAYNDSQGITARFNLNILQHINNKLRLDFDLLAFRHKAFFNEEQGRIEMHLVSQEQQSVMINDKEIRFKKGESIWTESSYKYSLGEFEALANRSGFLVEKVWTDDRQFFSVQYLKMAGQS